MKPPLAERIAVVKLLVLDVDGVLTDGSIVYTDAGEELKRFHVRDGSGIKLWRTSGGRTAIVSGRTSPAVNRRASELGVEIVLQGQSDKLAALHRLCREANLTSEQCCAIGDDLQDIVLLQAVGVAIAVADACSEVRAVADYTTATAGGRGAVRESIEWLLKSKGEWTTLVTGATTPAG